MNDRVDEFLAFVFLVTVILAIIGILIAYAIQNP